MRPPIALALLLAGIGTAAAGDIYCVNGGRDCSDRPSPGATEVRSPAPARYAAANEAAATAAAVPAPADSAANTRLQQDASKVAVQKDVAASRAEQCKQAKDKYEKSVESRRMYRLNKAGEREYFSDAEVDQARLNMRTDMERACGNGG